VSDFIVDASVAVKWFAAETDSLVADELSASNHRLFAPRLIAKITGTDFARHVMLLSDWRPE
jgi:predicted nucleic acid-binding protein